MATSIKLVKPALVTISIKVTVKPALVTTSIKLYSQTYFSDHLY